jgi:hypothetical protein
VVLGEAAVRPDDLSVDPTPIGTGEKRDAISDVVRLSKPLHGCDFAYLANLFVRLTLEKQLCSDRPRCNRIDRDLVAAQLVREYVNQPLNSSFRCDIWAVSGERFCEDAAERG